MDTLTSLGDVLKNFNKFDMEDFLYMPMNEDWGLQTKCAVLSDSDLDGVPPIAQQNELTYALGIASVYDIVINAQEQINDPTLNQILDAFLYYYDNDAFLTFDG